MSSLSFLLFFVVHLATSSVIRKDDSTTEVCDLDECHDAAEHILKWMNTDFKPCEDFYEYSCGYWHTPDGTVLTKKHNNSLGARGHVANFYLKSILAEEPEGDETPLYDILRKVFALCLDQDTIKAQGVASAVKVLNAAGGWPLLEDGWTGKGWDFLEANLLLGGQFMRLGVNKDYDKSNETVSINYLKIKGPFVPYDIEDFAEGLENVLVKMTYKVHVNVAVAFGAERERAEKALKDSMKFEIAMAEEIKKLDDSGSEDSSYTLKELREQVQWVNWTRLLENALPEDMVLSEDDTIVANPRVLNLLHKLVLGYPKETLANYLLAHAAAEMASEYLPAWMISSGTDEGAKEQESSERRYDKCVQYLTMESSLSLIAASYLAKVTADNTAAAWDVVNELKKEWSTMIEEMSWLDEVSKNDALESVAKIKLAIGFVPEVLDMKKVESYYKTLKISTSNYVEARLSEKKWRDQQTLKNTLGPVTMSDWTQWYKMSFVPMAGYNPLDPTILIAADFLHYIPLFSSKLPLYVKYGQLGYIIGHEMTHALDIQANPLKDHEQHWDIAFRFGANQTAEIYNEKKTCFIRQYSSFNDSKFTRKMLNGNKTDREDIADNGGMKLALRTYRRLAAQLTAPEPRLPQLEHYSPEQLFFISAANAMCHIPNIFERYMDLRRDEHTLMDFRIRGLAMNSPDFSALFSCKPGEPMNPTKKCEVW